MRLVDLEGFKFDLSGLAYISPTDFMRIGEYFMRQLRDLPVVEPEITHCKDCKWWDNRVFRINNRCSIFDKDTEMTFFCKHGRQIFT